MAYPYRGGVQGIQGHQLEINGVQFLNFFAWVQTNYGSSAWLAKQKENQWHLEGTMSAIGGTYQNLVGCRSRRTFFSSSSYVAWQMESLIISLLERTVLDQVPSKIQPEGLLNKEWFLFGVFCLRNLQNAYFHGFFLAGQLFETHFLIKTSCPQRTFLCCVCLVFLFFFSGSSFCLSLFFLISSSPCLFFFSFFFFELASIMPKSSC